MLNSKLAAFGSSCNDPAVSFWPWSLVSTDVRGFPSFRTSFYFWPRFGPRVRSGLPIGGACVGIAATYATASVFEVVKAALVLERCFVGGEAGGLICVAVAGG
jgi:hypothetical protein